MLKSINTNLIIHPDEFDNNWINRANKLNVTKLSLHPVGGYRATESLYNMLEWLKNDDTKQLIDKACNSGLQFGYQFHSAGYLLPRNLFESNPEYFRMDKDGHRVDDYNFCVSNEKALNIVSTRAAELASKLYKNDNKFYFWLDDKEGVQCYCDKCSKLSTSNKNMIVMNSIITELRKNNKDAKICYLAYQDTMTVPTIKPQDGIFLEYAPIERDINIDAENDPSTNIDNLKALIDFFGKKDSEVLEYWFDNSKYSKWTKPPKEFKQNKNVIKKDIEFYARLGFEYFSSFACYLGEDYIELFGEPDLSAIRS